MKRVEVYRYGPPEVLQYREADAPQPTARQIAIRVEAASVNFADIQSRRGIHHTLPKPPYVPGIDCVGVVEACGHEVTKFQPGQRVMAFCSSGTYTQIAIADEQLAFAIPDQLDTATAASGVTLFTAYGLLKWAARMAEGEQLVIHAAAGGVGTAAIQLARLFGAGTIIGVVGNEKKIDTVLAAGADHVFVRGNGDFRDAVKLWTAGKGADIVLDSVAGAMAEQSLDILARFGRLIHFGQASGLPAHTTFNRLQVPNHSIIGFSLSAIRKYRPDMLEPAAQELIPLMASGKLKVFVDEWFPLSRAADAHRRMEEGSTKGKLLLNMTH